MINKVFAKQIGYNVETYINDILVKSEKAKKYVKNLKGVFGILRKFEVNLEKCVLGWL